MTKEVVTQCCYCKANSINNKWITKWFNAEKSKYSDNIIANGCENCKNYKDNK